jgi:hypothetical protein
LFLTTCLVLSGLVSKLEPNQLGQVFREGLIITGWVAMWKPLEIYLYDWWPVRQEWLGLQRLARMRVRLTYPRPKPIENATNTASPSLGETAVA